MERHNRAFEDAIEGRPSPFTLWEGGRSLASQASEPPRSSTGELVVALRQEPLPLVFEEPCRPGVAWQGSARSLGEGTDLAGTRVLGTSRTQDRRQRLKGILLTMALSLACLFAAVAMGLSDAAAIEGYKSSMAWEPHEVVAGESIASILSGRELPPVEFGRVVLWVEEMNSLSNATIHPGQVLLVPAATSGI